MVKRRGTTALTRGCLTNEPNTRKKKMKKLLHIASFALAIILSAGSATAYQATGAVKEVTSTPYWPHWQELSLEKGDVSVSGPCVTFLAEVRQRRAFPAPMNLWQCMALASELSDISQGQHESLPIGTSIWAPYWPPEKETVSAQAVSQADFAALESEFALAKATMVSEAQLQRLLSSQASVLRSERSSELQGLREELKEEVNQKASADSVAKLGARITALEQQAPKETPKETPWYKEWWWTWLAIALNLLLLLLLAWWLFASRRSEKKEAFEVRGDLEALAESEIQDRYNCPGFTVDRLNNYAIAEEPLELVFTDLHPGAANTKVRVKRADPYLKLIGVSDTNERNVVKPDEDGRFSASSLLKALQTARETGCVLGLSKAKRT